MTELFRPFTTRDKLGRYYTENFISSLLVSQMETEHAGSILDLASGVGSLSNAASIRWKLAKIYSLDIENRAEEINSKERTHIIADALHYELPNTLSEKEGTIDIAVCNPPYLKPEWKSDYKKLAEIVGVDKYIKISKMYSSEILFLAQTIRMLKNGGEAGIILPDGIFSSTKYSGLRKYLLTEHAINKIIELPRKAFKRTEAKTHILIFNKNKKPSSKIELSSINSLGEISDRVSIDVEQAINRMDFSFYVGISNSNHPLLGDINGLIIKRGRFHSQDVKKMKGFCIHTTDIKNFNNSMLLPSEKSAFEINNHSPVAIPGDIVISRVGRGFSKKIAMISNGYAYISDCLFLIRTTPSLNIKLFNYLISDEGQLELNRISCGVAACHITITQLKKIRIPGGLYE